MRARARDWILFAAVYAAGCLLHLRFSLWLVRPRETAFGSLAFAELVPAAAMAAGAALAAAVVLQLRRSPRPWLTGGFWLSWIGAVALADRYLTFSSNEWAHYPQYALVAWLLARAMDPGRQRWRVGRVLFWVTLLGAVDELAQYLWITASYSDYFDFNDVLVNLVGAFAGVLLYYGSGAPSLEAGDDPPRVEALAGGIVALVVAAAFGLGLVATSPSPGVAVPPGGIVRPADGAWRLYLQRTPRHYGAWQDSVRRARYFVLPPPAGLGFTVMAGALFAAFGLRRKGAGR
mgnify:CR=1 FL=1